MSAEDDNYFGGGGSDEDLIGGGSDEESSSDEESVVSENDGDEDAGNDSDEDDEEDDVSHGGQVGGIGDDEPEDKLDEYKNEEDEEEEEEQRVTKSGKKIKKIPAKKIVKKAFSDEIPDDDDEDEDGEMYLKKFDREVNENYIVNNHPECMMQNYDEILAMTTVVRDDNNIIIDDLHKTNPFLTKYERARILGQRAKQIETGATPFVKVPENIIDGYLIAEMELQQSRIPFIIRRPLPNGGSEYWKISDLENIAF